MYKSLIRNAKQRKRPEKCRELEFPDDGQLFAVIEKMLGNGRVECYCEDGITRVTRIRGSMRKFKSKVIVEVGDLVLVSPWDFEKDKGDLIHKYTYEEKTNLMYQEIIPDTIHKKILKNAEGDFGLNSTNTADEYIIFANSDSKYVGHKSSTSNATTNMKSTHSHKKDEDSDEDEDSEPVVEEELDIDAI